VSGQSIEDEFATIVSEDEADYDAIQETGVREVAIHLTQKCNLGCTACYALPVKDALAKELNLSDLRWIEKTFKPEKVTLLGGEPLLYENIEEAFQIFNNVTISTNGYFLPKKIDMLKDYNVKVQISIEGQQEYNDGIRGQGSFERAMQAGQIAKENGLTCYFRVGYCDKNLDDIEWLLENISGQMKIPLALLPRMEEPPLDVQNQIWLFDKITSSKTGSLIALPHFWQYLGKHGRCNASSQRINVTYEGRITPCHMIWNYTLGQIGDDLSIINISRKRFIEAHKRIPNDCMFCPKAEVCKGGCLVTPTYQGCPLKMNFTIRAYVRAHSDEVNVKELKNKIELITNLVKDAGIC
jgi:radical SAM protein with 4Fe4S-binding SPASM domain